MNDEVSENLWSADFREIELRIAAALSNDKTLLEALKSPNTFEFIASKLQVESYPRSSVKLVSWIFVIWISYLFESDLY